MLTIIRWLHLLPALKAYHLFFRSHEGKCLVASNTSGGPIDNFAENHDPILVDTDDSELLRLPFDNQIKVCAGGK